MVYFCAPNYSTFNTHREGPRTKWLISWSWPIQTGVFFPLKKNTYWVYQVKEGGTFMYIYIYMNHIRCHWGFIRLVLRCFLGETAGNHGASTQFLGGFPAEFFPSFKSWKWSRPQQFWWVNPHIGYFYGNTKKKYPWKITIYRWSTY